MSISQEARDAAKSVRWANVIDDDDAVVQAFQRAIDAAEARGEARGHARGVAEERERAAGILETIRPRPIAYDAVARIIREQDQ